MIKKFIAYFKNKEAEKATMEYYRLLAQGGLFLKFIHANLAEMKNRNFNRDQRKRFDKELKEDGKFSTEIIEFYSKKIDKILEYMESKEKK